MIPNDESIEPIHCCSFCDLIGAPGVWEMRMRFVMLLVAAIAVVGIRPSTALAGKLRVCANGCPYSTIQAAIDAAQTGDTIKIAPGTLSLIHI